MKFRLLLILTACLLMFSIWVVLAVVYLPNSSIIEQASNGYATPQNNSKEIALADTSCKKITTTTNTQYFVPTKTTVESSSFLANPPSGVSVGSCAPAVSCGWQLTGPRSLPRTLPWCSSVTYGSCTTANSGAQIDCMDEWMGICNATNCSDGFRNTCECSASAPNSCSLSLPSCRGSSCSLTTGTPTSPNQWWVKWVANCGFACTGGYTGNDCLTPPAGGCSIQWYVKPFGPTNDTDLLPGTSRIFGSNIGFTDIGAWLIHTNMQNWSNKYACPAPTCQDPSWPQPVQFSSDSCIGFPSNTVTDATRVNIDGLDSYDQYWQTQDPNGVGRCSGKDVVYSNAATLAALPVCTGAATIIDGDCGGSNGKAMASYPTTNFCNAGTRRDDDTIAADGSYNWTCLGSGAGHTDMSCSATQWASCIYTFAMKSTGNAWMWYGLTVWTSYPLGTKGYDHMWCCPDDRVAKFTDFTNTVSLWYVEQYQARLHEITCQVDWSWAHTWQSPFGYRCETYWYGSPNCASAH